MNRQLIYPGAQPLESDILYPQVFAMKGLGHLAAGLMGTSTNATGFPVSAPGGLNLSFGPGSMYQLLKVDPTAFSSVPADNVTNLLKQGISETSQTFAFAAPASGQSINYLLQVSLAETDFGSTVLPYFNPTNPSQAFAGPGGSGTAQPTVRQVALTLSVKAGAAGTTGSQPTPTADSGAFPLWLISVAGGTTALTAANAVLAPSSIISQYTVPGIGAMLRSAATVAGLTPNPADPTQLYLAIQALAASAIATYVAGFTGSGNQLKAANGYQKLPGGLIEQWGIVAPQAVGQSATTTVAVAFPTAFPNSVQHVMVGAVNPAGGASGSSSGLQNGSPSTTGFNLLLVNNDNANTQTFGATWRALGY